MKQNRIKFGLALFALALSTVALLAQTNGVALPSVAMDAPAWLTDLLAKLVSTYPKTSAALVIVGFLRLSVKPALTIAHTYADATDTPKDNEFLDKIENSKWLKWAMYALDVVASIKPRK